MLILVLVLVEADLHSAFEHLLLFVVFTLPAPPLLQMRLDEHLVDEHRSTRCDDGALQGTRSAMHQDTA